PQHQLHPFPTRRSSDLTNNQILVSPQSAFLAQYFPAPIVPGFVNNNFVNNVENIQHNHQVSARLDRVASTKHNLSAVYTVLTGKDRKSTRLNSSHQIIS